MADDELGHVVRTGLDIDGSGSLDPGGNDRISDSDILYASIAVQWWQQTTQRLYPYAGDPTAVTAGIQRLLYSFLPRLPESPGTFSEALSRWINGHYPEDFAAACRLKLAQWSD